MGLVTVPSSVECVPWASTRLVPVAVMAADGAPPEFCLIIGPTMLTPLGSITMPLPPTLKLIIAAASITISMPPSMCRACSEATSVFSHPKKRASPDDCSSSKLPLTTSVWSPSMIVP